jgi:hypothetical protein
MSRADTLKHLEVSQSDPAGIEANAETPPIEPSFSSKSGDVAPVSLHAMANTSRSERPFSNRYESADKLVLDAFRKPGPFWFVDLGPLLVQQRWAKLGDEYGIDRSNYGTARMLERAPRSDRTIVGSVQTPIFDNRHQIYIESLRPEVVDRYVAFGLNFYRSNEIGTELLDSLTRAIHLISVVRGAAVSVSAVLSVLHLLKPESPEYDVSYSEPSVPFSIFVGVQQEYQLNGDLRLAEGILHECMHLQLTLIEEQSALIAAENEISEGR